MLIKSAFMYLWLIKVISCDTSFTVVLDTTYSMGEELDVIKAYLPSAINATNEGIENYIIVPFNDPDVGNPIVVQTASELLSSLNFITAAGGQLCPENSLTGIEKALQVSKRESYIFVFTDAYSKDANKLSSVENLCRNTRSKILIFLSGQCFITESPTANVQVYYDVAKACSGAVLRFDPATLRQAFNYIKEVINVQWTDIISDTFRDFKQLSFSVDSFTKTVLLVASGENPKMEITTPDNSGRGIEKILDSRNTQVYRLTVPSVGQHSVIVRNSGETSFVIYKKYALPLQFGFSSMKPRSINETSKRPMPGRTNYILIEVTQGKIKLESLEIQIVNEKQKKVLALEEIEGKSIYLTSTFIAPEKAFRLSVKGYDTSSYQAIYGVLETVNPQPVAASESRWINPKAQILETKSITVDFGRNATAACKVRGYPSPRIVWEDDNFSVLPSESALLEIPSLHISYVSLDNVTMNSTIYCKAKNSEGEDSQSLNVYVYRPYTFEVIQTPSDQTIEYGSDGRLYCEVSAYPEAEIKWYHDGTKVSQFNDAQVEIENDSLWIKNMTVQNVGEYKCEMTNEANTKTYSAFVNISGIEAPQVEVEKTSITLKLGDWSSFQCRVIKGKPTPTITWTFKSEEGFDFGSLPDGVAADDDGRLKIGSAQANHKGVYRCDATNDKGHHSAEVTVELKYPPLISDSETRTLTVKEEDEVTLPCEVDSSPAANVRWEMSRDDTLMNLDDRHSTDRKHTHRHNQYVQSPAGQAIQNCQILPIEHEPYGFELKLKIYLSNLTVWGSSMCWPPFKALLKDAGNYHCIAENDIGRAEKTITVNVLVPPYIEAPLLKTVVARAGENVVLTCNVTYGNPVPSTRWEFLALDSTLKVLSRNNASSPLLLKNVNYVNEGSYLCIAENNIGTDSIQIYVKVQ